MFDFFSSNVFLQLDINRIDIIKQIIINDLQLFIIVMFLAYRSIYDIKKIVCLNLKNIKLS